MSSGAYRAVGNFLALPSRRTLSDYTNVMTVQSGVTIEMIDRLKRDMHSPRETRWNYDGRNEN
jgi:hypothetical protein